MRSTNLTKRRMFWLGGSLAVAGAGFAVATSCVPSHETAKAEGPKATSVRLWNRCLPNAQTEAAVQPGNPPQHPDDCHGNPNFVADGTAVMTRGDVAPLPAPLKNQLTRIACRPHSTLPIQFFAKRTTRASCSSTTCSTPTTSSPTSSPRESPG